MFSSQRPEDALPVLEACLPELLHGLDQLAGHTSYKISFASFIFQYRYERWSSTWSHTSNCGAVGLFVSPLSAVFAFPRRYARGRQQVRLSVEKKTPSRVSVAPPSCIFWFEKTTTMWGEEAQHLK